MDNAFASTTTLSKNSITRTGTSVVDRTLREEVDAEAWLVAAEGVLEVAEDTDLVCRGEGPPPKASTATGSARE
jgi:hypothetical protein